jgi:hypothetical protein
MIRALRRRPARAVGLLLFALGIGVFAFKVVRLGLPLLPADSHGSWLLELSIDARGQGGRGSVRAAFPSSDAMQRVDDEYRLADRLEFSVRDAPGGRIGIWSGQLDGVHRLSAAFRLQLVPLKQDPDEMGLGGDVSPLPVPSEVGVLYGRPEPDLPSGSRAIDDLLETLRLPPGEDGIGRVRTVFAFVADEVATERTGSSDALLTLSAREGNEHGKARLLVTALRAAGIPARVIRGLRIDDRTDPLPSTWCEAYVGERWLVLSPTLGLFGNRPGNLVALSRGTAPIVEGSGVTALSYRYRALRERFEPEDLALLMTPATPWLNAISLYRLPLETQASLRVLLLLPAGALVLAVLRNLVGLPAFGTFLPVLVAFSFRSTDLLVGTRTREPGALRWRGVPRRHSLDADRALLGHRSRGGVRRGLQEARVDDGDRAARVSGAPELSNRARDVRLSRAGDRDHGADGPDWRLHRLPSVRAGAFPGACA